MDEMRALLADRSPVRIPRVHRELLTRRLLVQERFDGCTLSDGAQLDDWGIDRRALADRLLRSTLDQVLRAGFFHADPHPGNIFVFPDGTLGLIDFGAVGRLDSLQQAAVIDMFAGRHPQRREPAARRHRTGRRPHRCRNTRTTRARPRPAPRRSRPGRRHHRPHHPAGPRRPPHPVRGAAAGRPRHALPRPRHPRRHAARPRPRPVARGRRDRDDHRHVGRADHRPQGVRAGRARGGAAPPPQDPRPSRSHPHPRRPRRPAGARRWSTRTPAASCGRS